VSEVYQTGSQSALPGANGWGCEASTGQQTKYVQTVQTTDAGRIDVLLSAAPDLKDANNTTISLTPADSAGADLTTTAIGSTTVGTFKCGPGKTGTAIPSKYLPGSCKS
jgi:type IV pilus assembly protein PilA